MRIYVSGTFTAQSRLRPMADKLRSLGHEIVSTWLYEAQRPAHLIPANWRRALGYKDVAEVFASECLILDLDGESTTGGRYSEWGIVCHPVAMQLRYTVGGTPDKHEGVFVALAHKHFENWDELFAYFQVNHAVYTR